MRDIIIITSFANTLVNRSIILLLIIAVTPLVFAAEFQVHLPKDNVSKPSGRLLLLIEPYKGEQKPMLSSNAVYPGDMMVAAQEVEHFSAGSTIIMDTSSLVFKTDFASLPAGDYLVQAFLDKDYLYNLDQGGAGDLYSEVVTLRLPLVSNSVFSLSNEVPAYDLWEFPNAREQDQARREAVRPRLQEFKMTSELLSTFWGKENEMRSWVLLPKDYKESANKTWPVVFMIGSFSTTHKANIDLASFLDMFNVSNEPPMIWVFLDFWTPHGPSLFADSAHNGPWGTALVEEFIPGLEQKYRMDAQASGRLLTGHSSGGWSTVWLLSHFPEVFGGAWATSPDPLDFTSFLTSNLYAEGANVYFNEHGQAKGIARNQNGIVTSIADSVKLEEVLGPQGGIFQSWDWVFSPPDDEGKPLPLFDRNSGAVNPSVAAYWKDNFDLSAYIVKNWPQLQQSMNGKLNIFVGTQDNHNLEDSVYKLRDTMNSLGADAEFYFLEGKTHNNLFSVEGDPVFLFKRIANEMYKVARGEHH